MSFQNSTLAWHTSEPDLTPCFERTALIWAPCAFLWLFTPLEIYYLKRSKTRNVPWNWYNITKLILIVILSVIQISDVGYALYVDNQLNEDIYSVSYISPMVLLLTFCLSAVLLIYNRRNGMVTSGILFFFWLALLTCGTFQFRSEILKAMKDEYEDYSSNYFFISYMIYYTSLFLEFILNCFADKAPLYSQYPVVKNPCPEQTASFLSRLTFSWFDKLAWLGFRKPLEATDLWSMNWSDTSREIVPKFDRYWDKSLKKFETTSATKKATYSKTASSVEFVGGREQPQKPAASILPVICKTFGPTFIFGALLKVVNDCLTFVNPHLLKLLIDYIESDETEWKGYFYATLMLAAAMMQTIVLSQYFHRMFLVGLRIRTALISAIYRKSLRMSNAAKRESTVGEIVNLMSVDAQKFMDLTTYINMLWSAPLQIALALYFLWELLGPSVLAGVAVMIVLIPLNGFLASKMRIFQIQQMKYKDERVKMMNEILSGIKVIKLYAWEPSFEDQILKIRSKEVKVLKKIAYFNAGSSFIWSCAPFLVSLVTFATYVLSDENNVLDAKKAFVSLSLFNILRFPLSMLPMMLSSVIQAMVSVKRINKFMNSSELDPNNVTHDESELPVLLIENGTFAWSVDEKPVLRNININIKQGQLVAVVGTIAAGKSSLISAFLGEMEKLSGRVNTRGGVSYVPQQAWIQNATLRDNIIFGKPLDGKIYKSVIDACALKPDLDMLPGGDRTEIGEKGINLSGGQKQRVSLARAVYNNSDIYFLDDPLSAVDAHVGKHIFEKVIGPSGILRHKTRVLVTHSITFLPEVDIIIVLNDGEITEVGTYKELLDKKGAFAEFVIQHLQESDTYDVELEVSRDTVGVETIKEIQRQLSESRSETGSTGRRMSSSSVDTGKDVRKDSGGNMNSNGVIKQDKDKLIEIEKAETGSVKWKVYSHYLKSIGVSLSLATIIMNILYQAFSIGSNVWLGEWSSDNITVNDTEKRDLYLGVYGALGIGQVLMTLLSTLFLYIGSLNASATLHFEMLENILKSPNGFFDVTPLGRVLNRFAKEIDILDNVLPMSLRAWCPCFFGCVLAFPGTLAWVLPEFGCILSSSLLHSSMLSGLLRTPLQFFDVTPSGRVMSRFSKDVDTTDTLLPWLIPEFVYFFFEVIGTIVVISYTTPIFVTVIIPIGLLYYFIQRFYVATSRQLKRIESVSRSPIYSHFGETVTGTLSIRAYGVQQRFIQESEDKVDFNQICYYPSLIANRWLAVRLETIGNLIIFFAALFAVKSKSDGSVNSGLVGLSVTYALQITQTLNWLVRMTADVETNIVAVERIKEYAEVEKEAPWTNPNFKTPKEWPFNGEVQFVNYQVRYREGLELVLHGISFHIKGGEKLGIVGRTGAGKSSLTLALFRIIEAANGKILIDGIDISKVGLHELRSRLTIIPQDQILFSGSIRMNLDPFMNHSDDEVWRALELAHLKPFVQQLPRGLDHEVSEGGENFSAGQRQLICLARALLRKTKILILDEATAAVDLETDDLIQKTIRSEFKDCTVLTIAHRLNTILDSDRVIVLDKGLIAEFDTPQKLLSQPKSIFYGMAKDADLISDKKKQ
ncbi:UNVERIFIED_CONTAM: hypothetical protein PYX00_009752 [Menopon gallinae]|uniref:ABC-type glutathione-S-conjugate transporter n=1 Tax=Menopon gallinae TaxID=328185 RepID=A0AAW2HCN0_9NEOP